MHLRDVYVLVRLLFEKKKKRDIFGMNNICIYHNFLTHLGGMNVMNRHCHGLRVPIPKAIHFPI